MARKHQHHRKQQPRRTRTSDAVPRQPMAIAEKKPPIEYGKPFVLLEDGNKNTFEYKAGAWVPHSMSIAECRLNGKVTELPQKVKEMTRYEVRRAVVASL